MDVADWMCDVGCIPTDAVSHDEAKTSKRGRVLMALLRVRDQRANPGETLRDEG